MNFNNTKNNTMFSTKKCVPLKIPTSALHIYKNVENIQKR